MRALAQVRELQSACLGEAVAVQALGLEQRCQRVDVLVIERQPPVPRRRHACPVEPVVAGWVHAA